MATEVLQSFSWIDDFTSSSFVFPMTDVAEESPVVADKAISGVETSVVFFGDGDDTPSGTPTLSTLFFSEGSPTIPAETAFESDDLVSALRGPLSPVV